MLNVEALRNVNVLVFGDYMLDSYVVGDVNRISPEAPVPVLCVKKQYDKLGGAGNVVNGLRSLGASVRAVGWIGKDTSGQKILSAFENLGVDNTFLIQGKNWNTTVKTRFASKNQQFLRCDKEVIKVPSQIEEQSFASSCQSLLENMDVVIISDYAKGAVSPKCCKALISAAIQKDIPVIVDPKGSNFRKYYGATAVTPNFKELQDFSVGTISTEEELREQASLLVHQEDLKGMFVTRSEKGISLISADGTKQDFPAHKKEVVDVSGAGDTVVCVLALCIARHIAWDDACEFANAAASVVCSKFGTATLSLEELKEELEGGRPYKLMTLKAAKNFVLQKHAANQRVVFTNGCFDLLHYGHVMSFKQARSFGDCLLVAVNSDASVRRLKGDKRPIINQHDRIGMLCALDMVDGVILMDEDTPLHLISELRPDVIVKGCDWKKRGLPEESLVKSYGGRVRFVKLVSGRSTTKIIRRVIDAYQS
jgi:D-beta-D-heptose 7-phosphate kinase/D-beta-D-heptose 1-phosphate adenosyltransferase